MTLYEKRVLKDWQMFLNFGMGLLRCFTYVFDSNYREGIRLAYDLCVKTKYTHTRGLTFRLLSTFSKKKLKKFLVTLKEIDDGHESDNPANP